MTIVMMRSGGLGLLGWVGRRTANAFEAKIDNTIIAIARDLFVFIKNVRPASNRFLRGIRRIFRCYRRADWASLIRGKRLGLDSVVAGA
jgi:hypothetical protein